MVSRDQRLISRRLNFSVCVLTGPRMRFRYTFLPLVCVCMCDHTSCALNLAICHVVNGEGCVFVCVRVSIWVSCPWLQLASGSWLWPNCNVVHWEYSKVYGDLLCCSMQCKYYFVDWLSQLCGCVCACARGLVKFCPLPAVWMAMGECKCYIIEIYVFLALQGTGAGVCGFTRESNGHG